MKPTPLVLLSLLAGCHHGAARYAGNDPVLRAAELVVGDPTGHLPDGVVDLLPLPGDHVLALLYAGGTTRLEGARGTGEAPIWHDDWSWGNGLAFPDGRLLALHDVDDHEAAAWIDPVTLAITPVTLPPEIEASTDYTVDLAATATAMVITGDKAPLVLRAPDTLAPLRVLSPELGWSSPAFVADGTQLVAERDSQAVFFDVATGKQLRTWKALTLAAGPRDRAIVGRLDSVGDDLRWNYDVVELATGKSIAALPAGGYRRAVTWSADGTHVFVASASDAELRDLTNGRAIPLPHMGGVPRALFSRDGKALMVVAGGVVWRIDVASGAIAGPTSGSMSTASYVAPLDGGVISSSDELRVFDREGRETQHHPIGSDGSVDVALSRNGQRLVMAMSGDPDTTIESWDIRTGVRHGTAKAPSVVESIDIADDGTVTLISSGKVMTFHGSAVDTQERFTSDAFADALVVAADRAALSLGGTVVVTDAAAAKELGRFPIPSCGDGLAGLTPDGARVATTDGRVIAVWDVASHAALATARFPHGVGARAFHPGGELIAVSGRQLIFWNPTAKSALSVAIDAPIMSLGLDTSGERLALGLGNGQVAVWRTETLRGFGTPLALAPAPTPTSCAGDPLAPPGTESDDEGVKGGVSDDDEGESPPEGDNDDDGWEGDGSDPDDTGD